MDETKNDISTAGSSQYSDPTFNVIQIVNAAVKRLDDLNTADRHANKEMIALNKEIINLHFAYWDKLRISDEKLSLAESKRIDAIRSVDVGNVAIASEKAAQQATVLADQLTKSAEQLRNLVLTTATQLQEQVITPLMDRIRDLEIARSQTTGTSEGKEQGFKNTKDIIYIVIAILSFAIGYFVFKK